MLGVDLPFSDKLKSLLAPGSFAVKELRVIKSLLMSPQLVLLNKAICFPSASRKEALPIFVHLDKRDMVSALQPCWRYVEGISKNPSEAEPWNQTKCS